MGAGSLTLESSSLLLAFSNHKGAKNTKDFLFFLVPAAWAACDKTRERLQLGVPRRAQAHPLFLESSSLLLAFSNYQDTKTTKDFLFGSGRQGRRRGAGLLLDQHDPRIRRWAIAWTKCGRGGSQTHPYDSA